MTRRRVTSWSFGGPGAGKGTQAALLAQRLGFRHVATGDLFRAAFGADRRSARGAALHGQAAHSCPTT